MGYIGNTPVEKASRVLTEGTLSSSTNIIPVPGGFSPNNIFVYVNGSRQAQNDYDDSDGSNVDVSPSMPAGEMLPVGTEYVIEEVRTFESANHFSKPESDIRYTRNSTLDVDLSSGSVTLTESESAYEVIRVVGVLTANSTLIVPDTARKYTIVNSTSGAFTVTVKTAAGTGVAVPQGQARVLRSDGVDVVGVISDEQAYVGGTTIASGSAAFTNADNNIALTGVGVGVEVGDVVTVSGSTSNDTEYTVEVITDDNNVVVNQAHAGGTTTKALTNETATVAVKLLCKWYLAPIGLGQGWVDVTASRVLDAPYLNSTNRILNIAIRSSNLSSTQIVIDISENDAAIYSCDLNDSTGAGANTAHVNISRSSTYKCSILTSALTYWKELR